MSMKRELLAEIPALLLVERMHLVEAIWESSFAVPEPLPFTRDRKMNLIAALPNSEPIRTPGQHWKRVFARIRRAS
jgi:hypothetical protein